MKELSGIIIIFILAVAVGLSQDAIKIIDYNTSKFPEIESRFFVFDLNGNPVKSYGKENFNIRDNGVNNSNFDINPVTDTGISQQLSLTLTFDLGLNNTYHTPGNFVLGRQTAGRIVNLMDTGNYEMALTSYDYRSFLNREFTNNKSELLSEISRFMPAQGSLFNASLINEPAGALKINSKGKFAKSIILITDGGGDFDAVSVAASLKESETKLFVISIRKEPSQIMKDVAVNSGGWWFNLNDATDITPVVCSVLAFSKGYKPSILKLTLEYSCEDNHNIEILYPPKSLKDDFDFKFNNFSKSNLISDPQFLGYSSVEVGKTKQLSLTITAVNRDIFIKELIIQKPFTIVSGNVKDFLLAKDNFINVTVEYAPEQEAIVFSQLEIISDACGTMPIYITGGYPNTKPTEKTVKILHPNGGEYLIIGDTSFVKWLGLLPKDVIQLEYSTDKGLTWLPLATNITGLTREWIVPDTPSDSCLVKIIQLWPNNVGFTLDLKHKAEVNSAFFNSTGDLVLTASSDTTAVVWIANTGVKKFTLLGHNKPVHWAVFDPLDEYIATGSSDSTVIIWSQADGSIVKVIRDHPSKVESVNFSKSGNYFVSTDYSGYSVVRDRNWTVLKRVKSNDVGPSWYAEFNPVNEDFLLSANGDGKSKEWNWKDYTPGTIPSKVFDTKSIMCSHATYNIDATKVAASTSSGNPKKLYVWSVNNLDTPIYEISHNNDTIDNNSINYSSFFFHPDLGKEVLLTTSTDETARLWDAADGTPARINDFITDNIFREHRNSVTTAVFDRFGTRLLTASWDSTAKIWNLNQKELQQDVSDTTFTIAFARGKGMAIDMGTVYLGELKDSITRAVFVNESKFAYQIRNFKFSGTNAGDFEILTDLKFPLLINSLDSLPLEIRYYPKASGMSSAELEFELPAGVVVKSSITGFCDISDLKLNYPLVDFGNVEVGSFKDSTFSLIMTNESGGNVKIDSISVIGSYKAEFTSIQNVSTILQNGESIPVTLRLSPQTVGRKNAQYQVSFSGKGSPRIVNMFGTGTDARNDSLRIYVKDAEAAPGDIFQLPIYLGSVGSMGISDMIQGFTTYLKFNATLLEPLSGFKTSELIGEERYLSIELPKTFSNDSVLKVLEFRALWGNDTISPLTIEYTIPRGSGRISITENSAKFKLKGVCLQDGQLRLFLPSGSLSLEQNLPNPASDLTSITFSVLETGNTRIVLSDYLGNEIKTLVDGNLLRGEHRIDIDISGIAPGVYYYSMHTPSNIIFKTMLITR